jgi:hypothetical protein
MLLQAPPTSSSSPVAGLLLIAAIIGAVADYRYKRAGGQRPTRKDRLLFGSLVAVVAGAIALAEYLGADPYGILGFTILPLFICLFGAWELGRWRMRRKYPLPPKTNAAASGT